MIVASKLRFKDLCCHNKCLEKQVTWKPLNSASHIKLNTSAKQTKNHHNGNVIRLRAVRSLSA